MLQYRQQHADLQYYSEEVPIQAFSEKKARMEAKVKWSELVDFYDFRVCDAKLVLVKRTVVSLVR